MLISPDYQQQQQHMHETISDYGHMASRYGDLVGAMVDNMGINTLLDYGCGHNLSLQKNLKPQRPFKYQAYDPGVPEYAGDPKPAELVVCIDVLEHIEPDCLEAVLDHLEELTEKVLFATVHTKAAHKKLPDGRNAHLIQQPYEWWIPKLSERFSLQSLQHRDHKGFEVVLLNRDFLHDNDSG